LRRQDGSLDAYSSGTFVAADGSTRRLSHGDFRLQATGNWKSPYSKAVYPAGWQVDVPSLGLSLSAQPYLAGQEHHLTFTYWEGAVQIDGSRDGKAIKGSGYVELTGYAGTLAGDF
jgi:predicted secreted hydrolase